MLSAYDVEALRRYSVNPSKLGCVMLDVRMPDLSEVLPPEWAYTSPNPDHRWITGIQSEGHVTLLYGLLPFLVDRRGVDEVLAGWNPEQVCADELEVFSSPFPDEPYSCIVARDAGPAPFLMNAHARLSLLPHINTFPEYKAHVTLAYVHREYTDDAVAALRKRFTRVGLFRVRFNPIGLNYGWEL